MKSYKLFIESDTMTGYKVMRTDGKNAISGADSRQSFKLKRGSNIKMSGKGLYLAPSKNYVLDYYSGLADEEVLLKFEFQKRNITSGNIEDKEPELSVKSVKLIDWEFIEN